MKQTIQGLMLAGTLVLGGSALAQQAGKENKKDMAELRGFVVPTDEKALLERVHYNNQLEIKLGQLAQQNSNNPEVKSFGEQMVRDHTAADQKLMKLAQGRGMKLSDKPKPMNDAEKKMISADKAVTEELQALRGAAFDSRYMSNQVGEHDAALGMLMAGRQAITGNAQLTSMMDELSQTIAQHRQQAYSVLGRLGQTMGVGGAGPGLGDQGGHMGPGSGTRGGNMGTSPSGSGMQQPKK